MEHPVFCFISTKRRTLSCTNFFTFFSSSSLPTKALSSSLGPESPFSSAESEPPALLLSVLNLGKVQKFIVGADFEAYAEELEFFFVANGVTDSKQKKAVLLTNLPTETYQLAKDLMAPILLREDSLTYDTIVERLQKQLKPQKSALVARYEFDNRARNAGETVSQYVAVLKHLATDCKFNDAMHFERLRDRLVSGILDKRMMSELLKLKLEELTFDIAVAKCIAIEQSYKDVEALQGSKESNPVDLLSKSKHGKKPKPSWKRNEGVVSKETVMLRRWGSSIQKFGFINGVDNVN